MKPVDGKICSLNTRTSTRTFWQPSGKQAVSIAGLYFSVSVSQSWMELWARLFLLLLCDLMVWEADVWRVVRPLQKLLFYSLSSVRALWSLINQTLHINTFIFHQRPLSYHSIVVTVSLVFSCVSVLDKSVFLAADGVWIIRFHIYMPELHNFTLHADRKSTGFWSGGFCRKLGSNKRSPPCWKPASRLAPAAFSSLSFSLSLKTVLQFAADPLACLQRQRKRTWRSGRKWAGRR